MIRRVAGALAFALLACGEGTGPTSGANGIISFTFTGAGGGSYYVAARAPNTGEEPNTAGNFTAGISNDTLTLAAAYKYLGFERADVAVLGLTRATPGSAPISADCDPEIAAVCSAFMFGVNVDTAEEGGTAGHTCTLTAGEVTITSITTSRIVGTFSGTGECVDASDVTSPFAVTGGTFNVFRLSATGE